MSKVNVMNISSKYKFAWSKNTAATVGDSDINKSLTFKIALQVHADYKDNLSQTV